MEPNFLKSKELAYEILIRGETEAGDVESNRKILRALLKREKGKPLNPSIKSPFEYVSEVSEIKESLEDINILLSGPQASSKSLWQRLETRFSHLASRIDRLVPDAEQSGYIENLRRELLTLEGTWALLVSPPPVEIIDDPVPVGISTPIGSPPMPLDHQPTPHRSLPTSPDREHTSRRFPSPPSYRHQAFPKVYKWGISFSGSETPEEVFDFLDRVDELRHARGATKKDLFLSAIDIFKGSALIWFRSVKNTVDTWDDLLLIFKKEFLPSHLDFEVWEKIRNFKQDFSVKCTIYIATMENLFSRLHSLPKESVRLEYILHNLHNFYLERLALVDVTSIAQLSDLCRKLEDVKHQMFPPNQRVSKVSWPKPTSSGLCAVTCWNCSTQGHVYQECKAPRNIFCYSCGLKSFTTRSCPACAQKNTGEATPLAVASTSTSPAGMKGKRTANYVPKKGNSPM